MRTICRSVTPTGSTKSNDIHEQVAFTLPRNFETNKTQLSGGLKITNATKKGDQDRIYNGFRQSNHSGMSIDHMNSFKISDFMYHNQEILSIENSDFNLILE